MHTILITGAGILMLGMFVHLRESPRTIYIFEFIGIWLLLSALHLIYGVVIEGYPLMDELKIHIIVFGFPTLLAMGVVFLDR